MPFPCPHTVAARLTTQLRLLPMSHGTQRLRQRGLGFAAAPPTACSANKISCWLNCSSCGACLRWILLPTSPRGSHSSVHASRFSQETLSANGRYIPVHQQLSVAATRRHAARVALTCLHPAYPYIIDWWPGFVFTSALSTAADFRTTPIHGL